GSQVSENSPPTTTENYFLSPIVAGYEIELTPTQSGTLYFRVNVPPSGFDVYSGAYQVKIEQAAEKESAE
ncbi:MAG: hypothetical protein LBJ67_01490, partial [Planctomycetaceae bacterium]|nr:hypothetical protein [Planctomycetaceae bacterium]